MTVWVAQSEMLNVTTAREQRQWNEKSTNYSINKRANSEYTYQGALWTTDMPQTLQFKDLSTWERNNRDRVEKNEKMQTMGSAKHNDILVNPTSPTNV